MGPNQKGVIHISKEQGWFMESTVVMDSTGYEQKMVNILKDPAYKRISKNATKMVACKLTQLMKVSGLPEVILKEIRTYSSRPPRIYGLPNIH